MNEVPAAVKSAGINDARGAVFQFIDTVDKSLISIDASGRYTGHVVADMQMMVASASLDGTLQSTHAIQTGVNTIPQSLVDWAASLLSQSTVEMAILRTMLAKGLFLSGSRLQVLRFLTTSLSAGIT